MDNTELTGSIFSSKHGSHASLVIPVGDYKIMILSDDSCGAGKGKIIRSELIVFHKDKKPSENINKKIFQTDLVITDSDTLFTAISFLKTMDSEN